MILLRTHIFVIYPLYYIFTHNFIVTEKRRKNFGKFFAPYSPMWTIFLYKLDFVCVSTYYESTFRKFKKFYNFCWSFRHIAWGIFATVKSCKNTCLKSYENTALFWWFYGNSPFENYEIEHPTISYNFCATRHSILFSRQGQQCLICHINVNFMFVNFDIKKKYS